MRKVAITGLGCITPIGNDVSAFWENLINGRHGFAKITRFDLGELKISLAAEVKDFNPTDYMSKMEARKTDLYAQYAYGAASQAVADSGIEGSIDPKRLGVYVGSGIGGMSTYNAQVEVCLKQGAHRVSPFFVPMTIANIASAMIAIKYNARGVNLPIISACATSTHAIGEAFRAIKHGYADAIIAGGAEAPINAPSVGGFANSLALTTSKDPDACSIPFDKRRSGFVMGEGAGVLVLEELEHAKSRGANIYCEISGYANTCDAYHITAPQPQAIASSEMIRLVLEEGGVIPDENMYINPHGTSTPLNDKTETLAIKLALGENTAKKIPISSTKSMTGHMLGAAGAAEAIASIKTIETGIIPPTAGYKQPDEECDLDYVPNNARKQDINKALSISTGFGGHNAGVLFVRCS